MTTLGLRVTAVAAIIGPLLLLASTLGYIARGEGLNHGEVGGAIQVWAMIAFGLALVGLTRMLEPAAPRAATVVLILGLVGAAGGVGFGIDSVTVDLFGTGSLVDSNSLGARVALALPGVTFPLAMICLGLLLAWHRLVPTLVGIALAVAAILFPVSRFPDIAGLAVTSDLIMVAALGTIGLRLLIKGRPEVGKINSAGQRGSVESQA